MLIPSFIFERFDEPVTVTKGIKIPTYSSIDERFFLLLLGSKSFLRIEDEFIEARDTYALKAGSEIAITVAQ